MSGWLFKNDVYCLKCNNFNTGLVAASRYPASTAFIDMAPFDHAVFLIAMGTMNSETTFLVKQDTSATETGDIKDVTSATQVVLAGDGDKWLTIEFNANQLDRANSFRYVTLTNSGAAGGDDYACIFFMGFKKRKTPVTQSANYKYYVAVV